VDVAGAGCARLSRSFGLVIELVVADERRVVNIE
jgi:hypothetical protein